MRPFRLREDLQTNKNLHSNKTVLAIACDRFFVRLLAFFIICLIGVTSCRNRKELIDEPLFEGPVITMDSIYTQMSDSADVVLILKARKQNNFEGGDKEWPEGLSLQNMDRDGQVVSTFEADYVFYTAKKNEYRAEGNVVVRSIENGDELNTEELFWNPSDEKFYTDRFVTIQSEGEVHTGEGLTANQDFSSYRILKPQGTLVFDEE